MVCICKVVTKVVAVRPKAVDNDRLRLVTNVRETVVRLPKVVKWVTPTVVAVAGDEILGVGGVHPGRQRTGREARKHNRVWRTDPGAGQHCDRKLRYHRHIHRYHIVLADANFT